MKRILDPCCGSKMFWFDKDNPDVEFCDIREVPYHEYYPGRYIEITPDTICDFTDLPFEDESFYLVVFDPPHLQWAVEGGHTKMTKAEIIESLRDQAIDKDYQANGDPDSIFTEDAIALREAAGLLKASPEWINVKDKLPETNSKNDHAYDVLVYIPKREGCSQHGIYVGKLLPVKGSPDGSNNFWGIKTQDCEWTVRGWGYLECPKVTHWMPLPPAPKEEVTHDQN